jgi:hypothetical protein
MRKLSRTSAEVTQLGPTENRSAELDGGYTVDFLKFAIDMDGTEVVRGLPDDKCQCPHWGYVFSGTLTFRNASGEETFGPGDAFYVGPGHIPVFGAGVEYVQFSPTEELRPVSAHIEARLRQMMAGQPGS